MPGHPRFRPIVEELADVHDRKSADYGASDDPFKNLSAATEFGLPAWLGTFIRMNDKMQRLKTFSAKRTLANESVIDALNDIAVYAIIARIQMEEEQHA